MSIIDIYERAYERHGMEKEAEAIVEAYGTADRYLPEAYFGAFVEMEKEAHVEMMVDTFAPETGYIPAAYVDALENEMSTEKVAFQFIKNLGKGLIRSGHQRAMGAGGVIAKASKDSAGNVIKGSGGLQMGKNLGFGQQVQYGLGRAQKALGRAMTSAPGTTMAVGGLGTAAAGYGGYRMMGGGQK